MVPPDLSLEPVFPALSRIEAAIPVCEFPVFIVTSPLFPDSALPSF